jgi:hypothetical protein
MDYSAKYLKYKLKYKQQKNQLGGEQVYQYEDGWNPEFRTYTKWTDYSPVDSQAIIRHTGPGELLLSNGSRIDKERMIQFGRVNTRRIRIKPEDEANNLFNMVQSFPEVLGLDASNQHTLQGQLFETFVDPGRQARFIQLNPADYPDAYAYRNVGLYQGIIRLGKPFEQITVEDIRTIISQYEAHQLRVSKETEDFIAKNTGQSP